MITNLYIQYAIPQVRISLVPVVIWMHGYGSNGTFGENSLARLASRGLFAASIGMRGRNSASGLPDSSRREIYDIYDAWSYIKATFPSIVDPNYLCVCGYSGGGGNALQFACKFPDSACMIVSHFGMSNYGVTTGSAPWSGVNTTWMGGTFVTVPDNYHSNNSVTALGINYTGGKLYFFHDKQDGVVPWVQSTQAAAAMLAAGRTNYTENYTDTGNNPRWTHGSPLIGDVGEATIQTEAIWAAELAARSYAPWTIPISGTLRILGYVVTKRFDLWLGDGTADAADLVYNVTTRVFTITSSTGAYTYSLKLKGQTPLASVTATINGAAQTVAADGTGVVTYTG